MAFQLTDNNYKQVIKENNVVVVDLWAPWCGPCRTMSDTVEEVSQIFEGKALIAKLNVDDNEIATGEFMVRSIPTLLFFKNGELVDRHVGTTSLENLKAKIEGLL